MNRPIDLGELYANLLTAASPGGIERQEKQGQQAQAKLETLPIKGTSSDKDRKAFEGLGFVFSLDRTAAQNQGCDELFVSVKFPEGWKKVPTNHSMWSDLVDAKGRRRGGIFYKAAFYDRAAHVYLTPFISIESHREAKDNKDKREVVIKMGSETQLVGTFQKMDYKAQDKLVAEANAKLANSYPDWENPSAYWD